MNKTCVLLAVMLGIFACLMVPDASSGQSDDLLRKGIEQYKLENYEEAADILLQVRKLEPSSSSAAFFLGMAYKQMMDFPNAARHLKDAVTYTPRIKLALVELVEVLYQLGGPDQLKEAEKWILIAEQENIFPAKIAFLKGLIFLKQGQCDKAIEQFENAKALDKTYEQPAEFQIALCYMKSKELKKAKDRFQAAVQLNPQSDLASFARQYQDLVAKRIEIEKPLRVTVGVFGQYDTNVVLKPADSAAAPDITDEASRVVLTTLRIDYIPMLEGPWLFNAQYSASGNFHDVHATTHDLISNGIYLAPGYNFGRCALNLAVSYNHFMKRDPGYRQYLDYLSIGPLFRVILNQNQLLEFFASYDLKEFHIAPIVQDEDRDSDSIRMYAGWIKSFENGSFVNLKYEYCMENADGINWSNNGQKFVLNLTVPIRDRLSLQLSGQAFFQNYEHTNTYFNLKREDDIYQGTAGLTWECFKDTNLIIQYSRTQAESNISIYDYERDLYTAGLEYRF